ncbi:FAD:protein FMN transferase [Erythrobacter sp. 3-20A1M]|uniref:FAD:protein FMN transferase n=1 Tax=Erythrobacter sp. 3-20A1M TaxID=2653850 RepID=UPI001BFCC3F2|nr:FAD:protein FMN transferase [Erythrobacter sp. 3-20A1M]QWC57671.1 FAD:protein FMN transferase [Erythrobacter sp. 3-20A1M]
MKDGMGTARAEEGDLLLPPALPLGTARPSGPASDARQLKLSGETMGTVWSVELFAPTSIEPSHVRATLEGAFELVISQMSQWRSDSQLSRFNTGAAGSAHRIGAQFRQVLAAALAIRDASEGAFDPAIGTAARHWGFGAETFSGVRPGNGEPGDSSALRLPEDGEPLIQPGVIELDFSGIAKGFAVDLGIAALRRMGIAQALLEIGGELRGIGLQRGALPWWVDLEVPPGSKAPKTRIGLVDWAVATSGHWHRRRSAGGSSWSHSIDPRTAAPVTDMILSATVLHPGCMQADALATAIIVLGEEAGVVFADRHRVPARLVTSDRVIESAAWRVWRGEEPRSG